MGRQLRPVAESLVYHAVNRGNNRAAVFFGAADYLAFLDALRQTKERYPFLLYGYCLMSNHFHLVLQPTAGQSISRILQSLTVAHTWRYHQSQGGVGHVWQGRFRSPVIPFPAGTEDRDHQVGDSPITSVSCLLGWPASLGMAPALVPAS